MNSGVSKIKLKNILKNYKIRPLKRLGQNFLVDKRVLDKIILATELSKKDVVLEIGSGTGTLTVELAKRAKKVIAIEKDENLVKILKAILEKEGIKNVKVIKGDALKSQISNLKFQISNLKSQNDKSKVKSYKVVGNLPFYLTSPLIRKFLEIKPAPEMMVLMVQKEVAQRIVSLPPKMNLLAVSVQFYAKTEIISLVPKKSFWPQPKVDGAIIKLTTYNKQLTTINTNLFFKIVRAGFSHPRKQLLNNLVNGLKLNKEEVKEWLLKNNISPEKRAETLSFKDWSNLTKSFIIH